MKITISYRPEFVRLYSKLEKDLQEEVRETIALFSDSSNHKTLKVHKLHGKMSGSYSFSVNYKYRITFEYIEKNSAALLTVGDHNIYK